MLYTVEHGKLVDVRGNPDHPMMRGGLYIKLKDFAEHHYNPDRLLYPMKRTGPKGSDEPLADRGRLAWRVERPLLRGTKTVAGRTRPSVSDAPATAESLAVKQARDDHQGNSSLPWPARSHASLERGRVETREDAGSCGVGPATLVA